jgi:hypothetical protein
MVEQDIVNKRRIRMLTDAQIEDIVSIYDDLNNTYEIFHIINILRQERNPNPNRIVRDALLDGLLYVDNITDNEEIMLGLTKWGENVWWDLNER